MKYIFLGGLIVVLGIGFLWWNGTGPVSETGDAMGVSETQKSYPKYKEIVDPSGYVNTDKITIGEHIGKQVVLLDILTYSCINCVRTFPYVNAWYDKYKDDGLIVIGIHTPEFAFEKKHENVVAAMKKYGIEFPVVLDNNYATWRAYGNRYWPRKYLIDIHGNIVYDHIGEGGYEETEKKIQELLEERKAVLGLDHEVDEDVAQPEGVESVAFNGPRSPEIYFGAARNKWLGNGTPKVNVVQTFVAPKQILPNTLYLVGDWSFDGEYAESKSQNAKILFQYQAQKMFFVASSPSKNRIRVTQDGVFQKEISIESDDLYRLIENEQTGIHTVEIEIEDPGLQAFTFTFG